MITNGSESGGFTTDFSEDGHLFLAHRFCLDRKHICSV